MIKKLSDTINYIDIEYYFNNKVYKICYKYPNKIIFPVDLNNDIPFYQQVSEIITKDKKLNEIIIKYIQPHRGINSLNITTEDICKINKIKYDDKIRISNNFFKEKELCIYDKLCL